MNRRATIAFLFLSLVGNVALGSLVWAERMMVEVGPSGTATCYQYFEGSNQEPTVSAARIHASDNGTVVQYDCSIAAD